MCSRGWSYGTVYCIGSSIDFRSWYGSISTGFERLHGLARNQIFRHRHIININRNCGIFAGFS